MQERSELRFFFFRDGKLKGSSGEKRASPTLTQSSLPLLGRGGQSVFFERVPARSALPLSAVCEHVSPARRRRELEAGHGSGAGADLWRDCLGEESPVALKLLRCLILKVSGICLHVSARSVLSWGVFAQ